MVSVLDSLDETSRINQLLTELALPDSNLESMPAFPKAMPPPQSELRRWSVGSFPTGTFLRQVNWTNQTDYQPPRPSWLKEDTEEVALALKLPVESVPLCPGAVPLRRFLNLVNWENRDEVPALPTFEASGNARAAAGGQIIENFFADFGF